MEDGVTPSRVLAKFALRQQAKYNHKLGLITGLVVGLLLVFASLKVIHNA